MLRQRFYQKWNNDKIIYVKQVSTLKNKHIHLQNINKFIIFSPPYL